MSAAIDYSKLITVEEYLQGEEESEVKHEYHAGQVFAMAGGKESHEIVCLNLASDIHRHLRGSPCRVFKSDMKVKLQLHRDDYYYPDIMVECGPSNPDAVFKENPKLIIEVISDAKRDLIEKFFAYQQIETLEEYVVIDQDAEKPPRPGF